MKQRNWEYGRYIALLIITLCIGAVLLLRSPYRPTILATESSVVVTVLPASEASNLEVRATGEAPPREEGLPTMAATPTYDPLLTVEPMTPEYGVTVVTPIPTGLLMTPPPLPPTLTPLPTISADNQSPYASQKIAFQVITPVAERLHQLQSYPPKADWSPDGKILATYLAVEKIVPDKSPETQIFLFDDAGNELRTLTEGFWPRWSPTGQYIVYRLWEAETKIGQVNVIDVDSGKITTVTSPPATMYWPHVTWIADTELLYYLDELRIFDLTTGQTAPFPGPDVPLDDELTKELASTDSMSRMYRVSSLPQHGLIAIGSARLIVIFQRDENGTRIVRQVNDGIDSDLVTFAPDGTTFAYVSSTTLAVTILSLTDEKVKVELLPSRDVATSLVWSPDGASLMFYDPAGFHIVNRDGSGFRLIDEAPESTNILAWSSLGEIALLPAEGDAIYLVPVAVP